MEELVPECRMRFSFRMQKERSVIFREDDEGGRARVTTDEE